MSNPTKNNRTKERNAARKRFRRDHPEHAGKQLKRWPLKIFLEYPYS